MLYLRIGKYLITGEGSVLDLRIGTGCVLYLITGEGSALDLRIGIGWVFYLTIGTGCVLYLRIFSGYVLSSEYIQTGCCTSE